jgi:signal transduction histidine kinase
LSPALAWGERLRRTERFISFIRLTVIVFNSILYMWIAPDREHHGLAITIIIVAGLYALITVFWNPEQLNPIVMPVITMVADNILIAIWLYATGGYESPFFPLFYAEAAASVGRFGWAIGTGSAIGSAVLYLSVVLVGGNAPIYDVVVRTAYIFFIAAFVAYVVEVARSAEHDAGTSEAASEAYAELGRLKAAFVSTISHELRTPLTTIRGATTTLLRDKNPVDRAQARTLLEMIERQSGHLGKLIQDLIDVATIEQGDIDFVFESCDVVELIEAEVDRMENGQGHTVEIAAAPGVEPVRCDRAFMGRVFRNLLDNAAKFSPVQGAIRVEIAQEGERVIVDVIDSGIGIAREEHERIFDRFHQVDGSLTRGFQGAGIGLNIARSLVRLHRGDIEIYSELGKGARFRVSLVKNPDAHEVSERATARRSA